MSHDDEVKKPDMAGISCPLPISRYDKVQLAHGGGGHLMNELIEEFLRPAFAAGRMEPSTTGGPAPRIVR